MVTGPFQENCYLVWDDDQSDCIIIDPGADAQDIARRIKKLNLISKAIINTHGHIDHIGAVRDLQIEFKLPFFIHAGDEVLVKEIDQYCQMFGLPTSAPPEINHYLEYGQTLEIGGLSILILGTPGHTIGGVCLKIENHLFVGDTLFFGSIGRTDLPGGNYTQLIQSINSEILSLPDETVVYSGHGPETSVGLERAQNPFLK